MRPLSMLCAASALVLIAGAAQAQSAPRTLSWAGKPANAAHPAAQGSQAINGVRPRAPVADTRMVPALNRGPVRTEMAPTGLRPAPLLPVAGAVPIPAYTPPAPVPVQPAAASAPPPVARPAPQPVNAMPPPPAPQPVAPAPVPVPEAAPAPAPAAYDPMAPRADAPIFRLNRQVPAAPEAQPADPAPAPAQPQPQTPAPAPVYEPISTTPAPPAQGGRYYSVHRQAGQQPDAITMPEPVYLEAMALGDIETISSPDMAAPPEPGRVLRDANGRVIQTLPSEGDFQ